MKQYIGTKHIKAVAMNRLDYNVLRGWDLPADENGEDKGFLVEYLDGGQSNHPDYAGYISWSPHEQFVNAYVDTTGEMDYSNALIMVKLGKKIARAGWNGKGMYVEMPELSEVLQQNINPYFTLKGVDGKISMWVASVADSLATDWQIVD